MNPDWCFILDDGTGKAVGYCICAPDTRAFVKRFQDEYLEVVRASGIEEIESADHGDTLPFVVSYNLFHPEVVLHQDYPDLLKEYPAHLHIDILPSHQGQRWGQKMIEALLEKLNSLGIPGVHLGMVADNHGAKRFYERLRFNRFKEMNDQGEAGREDGVMYWVKKIT